MESLKEILVRATKNIPTDPMAGTSDAENAAPQKTGSRHEACPICMDAGYLVKDVPPEHPDFNRLFPCRCKVQDLQKKRYQQLMQLSNLGGLQRMRFDTFLPEGIALPEDLRRNLRMAYEMAREFSGNPQGWLVLMGGYGCGKTHLAASIANDVITRGEHALFVVVPDLLDHLRATFGPQSEVPFDERFESVRSTPLLILDDLGTHAASPWAQEKLYQIINSRYNAQLPTVITSNGRLEELEPRVRSRMTEADFAQVIAIRAPDFRGSGQDGQDAAQGGLNSIAYVSDMTFETFNLRAQEIDAEQRDNLENALALARAFADRPDGWLVFSGEHGTGKTHLAAAIANACRDKGMPVIFVTVPDLLDYLRAAYNPNSQVSFDKRFDDIRRSPLLILDDLGTESATPWAREKLFQIINYRFNARLPTVFTTVHPLDEIEPHIRSRMIIPGRCLVFALLVPSYAGIAHDAAPRRRRRKRPT